MSGGVLVAASVAAALVYPTVAVATYSATTTRQGTSWTARRASWMERTAGALSCVALFVGAIVTVASTVQLDGRHSHQWTMAVTVVGAFLLLIVPFCEAVGYTWEEWGDGHLAVALFWPLTLPLWLTLWAFACVMAFGPLQWGGMIGEKLAGHRDAVARRATEHADRLKEIERLERELGL